MVEDYDKPYIYINTYELSWFWGGRSCRESEDETTLDQQAARICCDSDLI